MCVFCFTLSMSGSYSVLLYAGIWAFLKKGWGGRLHRAILVAPDNPQLLSSWALFIWLPLFFISLFLPLFSVGSILLLLSPLPLLLQTQPRYPCQIHWRQPREVNMEPIDSLLSVCNSRGKESKHHWNYHGQLKTTVTIYFYIWQEYIFREKLVFFEKNNKKTIQ